MATLPASKVQTALFTVYIIFPPSTGLATLAAELSAESYHPHLQAQSILDQTAGLSLCPAV